MKLKKHAFYLKGDMSGCW